MATSKPQANNVFRLPWWILSVSAFVGMLASFVQTIERIEYAKNAKLALRCDINSVFSCSSVFDAWQSSVFGFSNSLMCIVFFAISLGAAIAALSGSSLHKNYRLVLWGASVFFLGFGAWYIWQSAYVINALCIFCIFCYGAVITMNWAWLRINSPLLGGSAWGKKLQAMVSKNIDSYAWLGYAVIFAIIIAWRFV